MKQDYSKIRTYFFLNKKSFFLTCITGIFYNSLMALIPILEGYAIDAIKENKSSQEIITLALLLLGFVCFVQINRFFKRYYVRDFANRMVLQMRQQSYQNLLMCEMDEFTKTSKGDIMNKELSDIKDSAEGVRKVLTEVFDTILLLIGYLTSMMIMDYKITLLTLVFLVASIVFADLMKKVIYKSTKAYKECVSENKDMTMNVLRNEVYYRGFGVSENYYEDYAKEQDKLEKKSIKALVFKSAFEPLYQAVGLLGLIFVIYLGGMNVVNSTWLIGTFTAYLTTYVLVATKASKTGKVINAYTTMKVSWKRSLPYLETKQDKGTVETLNDEGLMVKNLTFGFDDRFKVKNISFSLPKGKSLGICGMVHTGKSTLGAALSGIYPYEGSITLDGVELKDVISYQGKGFISYVQSQPEIFNASVSYNVSFKNESVQKELKTACLDQELEEKEILSHSLSNLSGGQLKRLMISRGLYPNSRLMIFDDPFNATDIEMSEMITDNILSSYKESAIIFINNQKEILSKMDYLLFLTHEGYFFATYQDMLDYPEFTSLIGGEYESH